MKGKRWHVLFFLLPFGFVSYVIGAWFYTYLTDPENAPSVTDLPGIGVSYFRRGWLIVKGQTEGLTGTADPVVIATGLIAGFEGFSSKAYADPKGQTKTYSIGYGHQIIPGDGLDTSSIVSESEAADLLASDLQTFAECVNDSVTAELTPQQLAALYSFCYNEGCHAFKSSTLLRDINAGDLASAVDEFARWNIAAGTVNDSLVARRQKESSLFASGIADTSAQTDESQNA